MRGMRGEKRCECERGVTGRGVTRRGESRHVLTGGSGPHQQ